MRWKFLVKNRKVWTTKKNPEGTESLIQKRAVFSHKWEGKKILGGRKECRGQDYVLCVR